MGENLHISTIRVIFVVQLRNNKQYEYNINKQPHSTRQKHLGKRHHTLTKNKVDEQYGIGVTKLLFWEEGDKTRTFLKKLKSVNLFGLGCHAKLRNFRDFSK